MDIAIPAVLLLVICGAILVMFVRMVIATIRSQALYEFLQAHNGEIEYLAAATIGSGISFAGKTEAEAERLRHNVIIRARRIAGLPKNGDPDCVTCPNLRNYRCSP
jgi:hypothetical protein